jgi:hypothetical protein
LLIELSDQLKRGGGSLRVVVGGQRAVLRPLRMTGVGQMVKPYETAAEAMQGLET